MCLFEDRNMLTILDFLNLIEHLFIQFSPSFKHLLGSMPQRIKVVLMSKGGATP